MEKRKSKSLAVASCVIFCIGLVLCLGAAIAYLILHEMGYQISVIGAFKIEHLFYIAGVLGVFVLIAIIIRIIACAVASKEKAVIVETADGKNFIVVYKDATINGFNKLKTVKSLDDAKALATDKEVLTVVATAAAGLIAGIVTVAAIGNGIKKKN